MTHVQRLSLAFFDRPVTDVARELLGKKLMHGSVQAQITETEAYLAAEDDASHYVQGKRRAQEAFARGPGTVYLHPMRGWGMGMDLVARGGSVLLRAVDKTDGPTKLVKHLVIPDSLHCGNVTDPGCPLGVFEGALEGEIEVTPRKGITLSAELPLRFVVKKAL